MTSSEEGTASDSSSDATSWVDSRFRQALDAILDLVAIFRPVHDGRGSISDFEIVWMNTKTDALGRTSEDLVGRRLTELYPTLADDGLIDGYRRVIETGEPLVIPVLPYQQQLDGVSMPGFYALQASPFGDGIIVASRDVTEQENSRRQLEDVIREFEAAQRRARIGTWRHDVRTGTVRVSPVLQGILGFDSGQLGDNADWFVERAIHPDDVVAAARFRADVLATGQPRTWIHRVIRADGEVRYVRTHAEPALEDGEPIGLWGTTQDVTTEVEQAEALSTAESLVAVERSIIERMQRALLPVAFPNLERYRICGIYEPADVVSRVGGDWYDLFLVDERNAVLVVGDVAGHGIESAALMSQARSAVRAYAHVDPEPARILSSLNVLGVQQWPETFVTLLIAVLDLSDGGAVTYASGGHLPPLLIAGAASTYLDPAGGPVVGPLRHATFSSSTVRLQPGQRLLLFTDGLVESRGQMIDDGLSRLLDQARASSDLSISSMCDRVRERMTVGRAKDDDLCMLCIEHN